MKPTTTFFSPPGFFVRSKPGASLLVLSLFGLFFFFFLEAVSIEPDPRRISESSTLRLLLPGRGLLVRERAGDVLLGASSGDVRGQAVDI